MTKKPMDIQKIIEAARQEAESWPKWKQEACEAILDNRPTCKTPREPVIHEFVYSNEEETPMKERHPGLDYGDDGDCTAMGSVSKESRWAIFPNFPEDDDQIGLHLVRMLNLHIHNLNDDEKEQIVEILFNAASRNTTSA